MDASIANGNIPDRLTVSAPPEAFTSSEEDLTEVNVRPLATSSEKSGSTAGTSTQQDATFRKQYPETAGETDSQRNRRLSRECSTVIEEESGDDDSVLPTDSYGFFINGNGTALGESKGATDLKKLRKREMKWVQMLDNWGFFMDNKFDKIRERCRKGIPPSLRGRAWKYLTGAAFQMDVSKNRLVFDYCVRQEGEQKWLDDIRKDLNRQFPEHELFARSGKYGESGKDDLYKLLKAWTVLHPEEGYCQGQAPIASVLLMHMPVKDAFYCFVQICHKYLTGYYSPGLEAVQIDGDVLNQLIKDRSKITYYHLKKHNVDPVLYMIEWFMCAYCRTLPWPTVLRIWDMFLCEGVKVLFKTAIVLIKYTLGTKEQLKQFNDLHGIVTRLKNLPKEVTSEEFLIPKIIEMRLDDYEMEKMHFRAMKLRHMKEMQPLPKGI